MAAEGMAEVTSLNCRWSLQRGRGRMAAEGVVFLACVGSAMPDFNGAAAGWTRKAT